MKARHYTEEQIIAVLKEGEAGIRRKYGMRDVTYYTYNPLIILDKSDILAIQNYVVPK